MEHIKLVLGAIFSLGEAVSEAEANDGEYTLGDLPLLAVPAMKIPGAVAAAPKAMEEFKALDNAKRAELIEWVKADFDIQNDKLEAKIESVLGAMVELSELFKK